MLCLLLLSVAWSSTVVVVVFSSTGCNLSGRSTHPSIRSTGSHPWAGLRWASRRERPRAVKAGGKNIARRRSAFTAAGPSRRSPGRGTTAGGAQAGCGGVLRLGPGCGSSGAVIGAVFHGRLLLPCCCCWRWCSGFCSLALPDSRSLRCSLLWSWHSSPVAVALLFIPFPD